MGRFVADAEALYSYEGTREMNTLIVGRAITERPDLFGAVVVGGTPLTGGRVRILGTVVGALLMQLISATFIMNDLPFAWAQVLTALIVLLAIYVQKGRGAA